MVHLKRQMGKMSFMSEGAIKIQVDALLEKANALRYRDSHRTINLSKDALILCEKIQYLLGEKVAKVYMARSYGNIGNYEEALDLINDSLPYFIEENFYDLQWLGYNLLGIIFCELGDLEKSMNFYYKAKAVAAEIDLGRTYNNDSTSETSLILTLNNIAENYKFLNEYTEALNYCEQAYTVDTQSDYSSSKGLSILSLGEIYYLLNDYEKANNFAYQALHYLKYYNYALAESETYKLLALTSWKKGDCAKADEYFLIALNLNEKESVPYNKIETLIAYSNYLRHGEKLAEMLDALTNACNLSIKYNLSEKVSKVSLMLSFFYGNSGDYESSFKYTILHDQYEKISLESNNKNIIRGLKIKNKMEEIELENNKIVEKNSDLKLKSRSLQLIVEKISIISKLGQKITSTLNMDSIIDILYSSIKGFIDLSYFSIGIYDENNSRINYLDVMINAKKLHKPSISLDDPSFTRSCIRNGQFIIINDASKEFPKYVDEETYNSQLRLNNNSQLNSMMFCPLIVSAKHIGVMTIQSEGKNAFTPYHIEMIKALSSYAAIAINNAIKSTELEMEVIKTKEIQSMLEKSNVKLLFLSENDNLTGIHNRRKFDTYLNMAWNLSIEESSSLSLLMIDIDYFKEYNDNYGHLVGDECLVRVANALAALNHEPHFIARYGGDEFVIVLLKCPLDHAIQCGEIIRVKIEELNILHQFSKVSDRVTLSIGATSVIPNETMNINYFIKKADDALYLAKRYGKDRISTDECYEDYAGPQRRKTDLKINLHS